MASAMPFNSSRYCDSNVHVHSHLHLLHGGIYLMA